VVGCSETGSEADVSESCQILLGLEAHGAYPTATDGSLKVLCYTEGEMAGNIPNLLGNSVDKSELVVNLAGDIGEGASVESAGKGTRLEDVAVVVGGVGCDEVSSAGGEMGLIPFLDPVNSIGPVQSLVPKSRGGISKKGGCEKKTGDVTGPKVLRTRRGDVCVDGPSFKTGDEEVRVAASHLSDEETHVVSKKTMSDRLRTMSSRSCANRKGQTKRPLPELPPKKVRYFSAPPQPRNRPSRRKKPEQMVSPEIAPVESDSIHNSDPPSENQGIAATNEEFLLEVVLPYQPTDVVTSNSFLPLANQEESGAMCLINDEEVVVELMILFWNLQHDK
jgi:hypothetical protein